MIQNFSLSSESIPEIVALSSSLSENQNESQSQNESENDDLNSNVTIKVCGTDFLVPKSLLTFISPFALAESSNHSNVFTIDCPSNTFGVSPSKLIQHFESLLSLFEGRSSFSFDESDYFSIQYLFKSLKSESLIRSFNDSISNNSETKILKVIPFTNFDFSEEFTFSVSNYQFKCGFLSASLISPFVRQMIENENRFEIELQIPPKINEEVFLKTFCEFFLSLNGFSFSINEMNASSAHSIGRQLLNPKLLNLSFSILSQSIKSKSPIDQLLFFVETDSTIETDLINSIASEFYQFSKEQICQIPFKILSQILSSNSLKIESETHFFDLLISLYSIDSKYFSCFEFVKFSQLSNEQLIQFFDIFNPSFVSSNLWNSISSIFKKPQIPSNRYKPNPPKIEKSFPIQNDGSNGLFQHFRSQNSNQNPHDCQIVKVTASSILCNNYLCSPQNILIWDTDPHYWYSHGSNLEWIDIDLLGKPFILKGIVFLTYNNYTPKKWILQGSNQDGVFKTIYQSDNDSRFNSNENATISISIDNRKHFNRFRITAQDETWHGSYTFVLYSLEFFGDLILSS
jgi:hypothetical protein